MMLCRLMVMRAAREHDGAMDRFLHFLHIFFTFFPLVFSPFLLFFLFSSSFFFVNAAVTCVATARSVYV